MSKPAAQESAWPRRAVLRALTVPAIAAAGGVPLWPVGARAQTTADTDPADIVPLIFSHIEDQRLLAHQWMRARKQMDVVPALIMGLRFASFEAPRFLETLQALTGESIENDWFRWMEWLQVHDEVKAYKGFEELHATLHEQIDPNFRLFIYPGVAHEIRIEEIVWGGVRKDGIPALTNPPLITPAEATFMTDDELVFGVEINGDARAYPLRFMDWHEMFNDVIGGVPVSLAYCTLCGSGILFDTEVEGRAAPFVFGSSGFLYRSNKLMYDQETNSLWNQWTGRPVVGALTGSGIELKVRPVVITSWGKWTARHPDTKTLALETGFERDYTPGAPYGTYFNSADLMFPAVIDDARLNKKDYVFALRVSGVQKAWPVEQFRGGAVIHDSVGALDIVLVGDAASRTVRAYRGDGRQFALGPDAATLSDTDGVQWTVTEDGLVSSDGTAFTRLPGHITYWFAFRSYLPDAPVGG
ncbi:MAG: DUF3179 domain-containing protein [Alphaproteobacteria bacterium]|nr:DUF3179 domain-containing protein [Alphaproteobacteria bacterium]